MTDQTHTDQGHERGYDADGINWHAEQQRPGIVREFWDLLRHYKKWWLIPIIVMLLVFGALLAFGSSLAAPFIYPLF